MAQDSVHDPEIIEAFKAEIVQIKAELVDVAKALEGNVNQPELFLKFAQIIDRIYGTALTLGFKNIGAYAGVMKSVCQKCGNTKIQRSMPPVFKMVKRCIENFDAIIASISRPAAFDKIQKEIELETKRAHVLDKDIFSYSSGG